MRFLKLLINPTSWSIRWRLTLWYASCALLILTASGIVSFYGFRTAMIADTDRSLTIEAARMIPKITGGERIKQKDADSGEPQFDPAVVLQSAQEAFSADEFDSSGDPVYMRLVRASDDSVAMSSNNIMRHGFVEKMLSGASSIARKGPRAFFIGSDKENELRVLLVPVPRSPYTLQLATPWARNEDALAPVTGTIAWIVLVFVLISGFGGWMLIGRTLQPINEIVTEAKKLRGHRLEPAFVAKRTYGQDEIGNLVSALNDMMSRVHRAVATQRRFTADASHDLRTPLTILRGELEFALARDRSPEQYRQALRNALEAADKLIRIVADLNALSAAESDSAVQSDESRAPVDVAELCRSVLAGRQSEADARMIRVAFRTECRSRAAVTSADPLALERAIANLIDNAIRYNRPGGKVEVVVGVRDSGEVTIDVIDTGIGISEADRAHIFERFYRGDKARRSGENEGAGSGSGLGLAIAKYVVASCGGELRVTSEIDRGSRFTISLPALSTAADSQVRPATDAAAECPPR